MPTYTYFCDPCNKGYEKVLSIKDCAKRTRCPKCKKIGKKTIELRQHEPTFTDKLYPYYDKALNKIFETKSDRAKYLEKNNLHERGGNSMTRQQERRMYNMRIGRFDPREARHALKD